jgi:hypothetical protein
MTGRENPELLFDAKKLSEYWVTICALTDTRPVWWKRAYIAVVF